MNYLMSQRHHQRDPIYHCLIVSQQRHVPVFLLLEDAAPVSCLTVTSSPVSIAWCRLWVTPGPKFGGTSQLGVWVEVRITQQSHMAFDTTVAGSICGILLLWHSINTLYWLVRLSFLHLASLLLFSNLKRKSVTLRCIHCCHLSHIINLILTVIRLVWLMSNDLASQW
jgi:hypothetical protein